MKTFNRICIRDYTIEDSEGTKFSLRRGKEYLTSACKGVYVTVFSTYWVDVPVTIFAGAKPFTH